MRKKILWAVLGVVVVAGIIYYYTSAGTKVETAKVVRSGIEQVVVDTGYVQAADKIDLYAQQMAKINSVPVAVGDKVVKGQVLMSMENEDLAMSADQTQIQLSQAQAAATAAEAALQRGKMDLDDAQKNFDRMEQLFKAGAISQADYDLALSQLSKYEQLYKEENQNLLSARQQIGSYQEMLNSARQKEQSLHVKSTMDGVLMQLPVRVGEVVSPGTLLASVARTGSLEIKADILSDDLGKIQVGQKVKITAPVLAGDVLSGEIVKIYPQAEEKQSALGVIQRRVPVIIALTSTGNLKPGYEVRVSIVTSGQDNVLLIPRQAVVTGTGGEKQVMMVVNGRVVLKSIKTGSFDSQNIEIMEGLNEGDLLVKDASTTLAPNTRVKTK
jgi:HlyD family secretion protein